MGHIIQVLDAVVDFSEWRIGTEQYFVSNAIFDRGGQCLVETQAAKAEARHVPVYVPVLTDDHHGIGVPRVSDVANHLT